MDLNVINQFRLKKEDLPFHKFDDKYWFKTLSRDTVYSNKRNIEKVIDYHHQDLNWEDTPDYQTVVERLNFGSKCHLWMFEEHCLGWHWTNNSCITKDWKSTYQAINSNEIYIGGALVSRKYKPFNNSAWMFYRQGFEYSFISQNKDTMYLYSDDWNRASAMLCYRAGFMKYNFLK